MAPRKSSIVGVIIGALVVAFFAMRGNISQLEVERLSEDLHVIRGLGGNVAVLKTSAGAVVVDSMTFTFQGEAIREEVERLTGSEVQMLINTHYHLDHTHGNPAFSETPIFVSTEKTRQHLEATDAAHFASGGMPNQTFDTDYEPERTIRVGNKTLRLLHPGRGHTDGDLVVYFEKEKVAHFGDLYFNHRYPNIDLAAGGSVAAWGDTIDRAYQLPFERVIPGHGLTSDREGPRQFQRFIRQLAQVGRDAAAAGWSLEKTIAEGALSEDAGYEAMEIPLVMGLNRAFVLQRAWEEATGAVPQ
jgi:cyclase